MLTLTSTGDAPVDWSLRSRARWLTFSQSAGRLAPGESVTVYIRVDRAEEPHHAWSVRVEVAPSGAAVRISGDGTPIATPSSPDPGTTGHPGPGGSSAPASTPPTKSPGSPTPTPTPPSQSPTPTETPTPTQTPPSPTPSS
ncbi:BACON domain-containing protein [Streptomyces xanthochromogenes]